MEIEGWRYYNHAAIPTVAPHESADITPIESGNVWRIEGGTPYLARWTENFDCGYETNWWYVIKDSAFDINSLKSKRRYEITKGKKFFDTKVINPIEYREAMFAVTLKAYSSWPAKYRPSIEKESFYDSIDTWSHGIVFGAFFKDTNEMCGYAYLKEYDSYVDFSILRTDPLSEKTVLMRQL